MGDEEQQDDDEREGAEPPPSDEPVDRKRREIADVLIRVLRGRGLA